MTLFILLEEFRQIWNVLDIFLFVDEFGYNQRNLVHGSISVQIDTKHVQIVNILMEIRYFLWRNGWHFVLLSTIAMFCNILVVGSRPILVCSPGLWVHDNVVYRIKIVIIWTCGSTVEVNILSFYRCMDKKDSKCYW